MKFDDDYVQSVRILVIEGPREWVEMTNKNRFVKGTVHPGGRGKSIREVYISEIPMVVVDRSEG